jgi:hypothetical protein
MLEFINADRRRFFAKRRRRSERVNNHLSFLVVRTHRLTTAGQKPDRQGGLLSKEKARVATAPGSDREDHPVGGSRRHPSS